MPWKMMQRDALTKVDTPVIKRFPISSNVSAYIVAGKSNSRITHRLSLR